MLHTLSYDLFDQGFLIGSLEDFSKRLFPFIEAGSLPYRDFFFEYPPLFFAVLKLVTIISQVFSSFGPNRYFASQFFVLLPAFAFFYLWAAPKNEFLKSLILLISAIPLMAASYDYLPTLLSIAAILLLMRGREVLSVVLLSLAVGLKFYPLIYLPLFFLKKRSFYGHFCLALIFFAFILLPYLPPLFYGGLEGIKDFLSYQLFRGIQYESLVATPLYLLAGLSPDFKLYYDIHSRSTNITYGKNDSFILGVTSFLFVLFYLLLLLKIYKRRIMGEFSLERSAFTYSLTVTLLLISLNKVLSPQFLIWYILLVPFLGKDSAGKFFWPTLFVEILTVGELGIGAWPYFDFRSLLQTAPLIIRNIILLFMTVNGAAYFWPRLNIRLTGLSLKLGVK